MRKGKLRLRQSRVECHFGWEEPAIRLLFREMGSHLLKRLASRMSPTWQLELKRHRYRRQIARGAFRSDEPEDALLESLLGAGDWAIDVGRSIGHYTKRMSALVGADGRVIAFEPVAETFSLLAANVQLYQHQTVTLLNAAASEATEITGISIPRFENGLPNYYEASVGHN